MYVEVEIEMQKPTTALMLLEESEQILEMLEEGNSAIEVQKYLLSCGHQVSINNLRLNLRVVFPDYVIDGRFSPKKVLIRRKQRELQARLTSKPSKDEKKANEEKPENHRERSNAKADPSVEASKASLSEDKGQHVTNQGVEDRRATAPLPAPALPQSGKSHKGCPKTILTLRNGVTIDEDVKDCIGPEEYRLLTERYVHIADNDEAVRMLLTQTVGGRDYLRGKHEAYEQMKDGEDK